MNTTTRKPTTAPSTVPVTTKAQRVRKPQTASTVQNRPPYTHLSFIECHTSRGSWRVSDWFAVPDEDYGDGWMTGLRAFQELQQFIKTQPVSARGFGPDYHIRQTLDAAFKAMENPSVGVKGKRGAACAFTQCVLGFLLPMLRMDTGRFMVEAIAYQQELDDQANAREAQERAAFIERMRAARAAKRAEREALASSAAAEGVKA
ncbi:MAG: hypothetical protein KGZ67_02060 [Hydrogenophaga sp.]|jgi:hypothetical protein|nr:hypothetical protein [Hydrogenophaga sp.]